MRGYFVVIEGGDCVGKTTQAGLLVDCLKAKNYNIKVLDFPSYEKTPGGLIVRQYLNGGFGTIDEVRPEVAALTYVIDRYQFAGENQKALDEGMILISNRYTQSNMGHQGGKFKGAERDKFFDWLEAVESRMPQPDKVIYLDLPVEVSTLLLKKRGNDVKGAGKKDIHESNIQHLMDARDSYLYAAKLKGWKVIDCKKPNENNIRSPEEIHKEILETLISDEKSPFYNEKLL